MIKESLNLMFKHTSRTQKAELVRETGDPNQGPSNF